MSEKVEKLGLQVHNGKSSPTNSGFEIDYNKTIW